MRLFWLKLVAEANKFQIGVCRGDEIGLKCEASPWWGSCHRKVTDEGNQKKVISNTNLKIVQTTENTAF